MRSHEKDPRTLRQQALLRGAEQAIVAECPRCAEDYFALARAHGATESDIQAAVGAAKARYARLLLNRRAFLKLTAAGTASVVLAGIGASLGEEAPATAAAEKALDETVWVHTYRSPQAEKGEPPTQLIGVSATGKIVAHLDPLRGIPLRSGDGRHLVVVGAAEDGSAMIAVYDARSGKLVRDVMAGAPISSPEGSLISVDVVPALSANGAWFALLKHVNAYLPETVRQVKKGGAHGVAEFTMLVGEQVSSLTLEVINLTSGMSFGMHEVESQSSPIHFPAVLFAHAGPELLVSYLRDNQTILRRYRVESNAVDEQRTAAIAGTLFPHGLAGTARNSASARFLTEQGSIAAFASAEQLITLDAVPLNLQRSIPVSSIVPQRGNPTLIISATGDEAYIVQPDGAAIQFIDMLGTTVATLQLQPDATRQVNTYPMVAFGRVAYGASPARLYIANGEQQLGLTVVDVDSRSVVDRWLDTVALAGVWIASDEQWLVVVDTAGALFVLDPTGTVLATVPIGAIILEFL